MGREEDFLVDRPYCPTSEELQEINAMEENGPKATDWDSKKKAVLSFKENIGNHMYKEQHHMCAYCRMPISKATQYPQRDHIVPKSIYPKWTFETRNLCVACEVCNQRKQDKDVLLDSAVVDYPMDSASFNIVNPFLDRYSEHINLLGGVIYQGITDKGRNTIKICNLDRPYLAEERAKKKYGMLLSPIAKVILEQLERPEGDTQDIMDLIAKVVSAYKNRL